MAYKPKNSVKSLCSGSPAKNLKSGGKMISSDKGSSNYMKEDPGSPAKALKPEIKNFFSSLGSKIIYQLGTSPNEKARDKARSLGLKNNNTTSVNKDIVGPKNSGQSSTNKPAPDVFKGDFSDPNKTSAGSAPTVKPRKKVTVEERMKELDYELEQIHETSIQINQSLSDYFITMAKMIAPSTPPNNPVTKRAINKVA